MKVTGVIEVLLNGSKPKLSSVVPVWEKSNQGEGM